MVSSAGKDLWGHWITSFNFFSGRTGCGGWDFPRAPRSDRRRTSKPRFSSSQFPSQRFQICAQSFSLVADGPNNQVLLVRKVVFYPCSDLLRASGEDARRGPSPAASGACQPACSLSCALRSWRLKWKNLFCSSCDWPGACSFLCIPTLRLSTSFSKPCWAFQLSQDQCGLDK